MTGELYIYPVIEKAPFLIRGWRTWLWLGCCFALVLWFFIGRRSSEEVMHEEEVPGKSWKERIEKLRSTRTSKDAAQRYTTYQILLREIVGKETSLDLRVCTLQACKERIHGEHADKLLELLRTTYYYPYNLEASTPEQMNEYCDSLLLFLDDYA